MAAAEKKRQERIQKADADLKAYQKQIAAREADLDKKQQANIAARQKALQEYQKTIPDRLAKWIAQQNSGKETGWVALDLKNLKSSNGAKLEVQKDKSVFASGREGKTNYSFTSETTLEGITGLRIEALTDKRLPSQGPGRPPNGNFVLTELELTSASKKEPNKKTKAKFGNATATFSQQNFNAKQVVDGNKTASNNGWAIAPQLGKNQTAVFELKAPVNYKEGTILSFVLHQNYNDGKHALGRFRVSVTTDPLPLKFGMPKEIKQILALKEDARTDAQKKKLTDYFQKNDSELKKHQDALTAAKKPRPIDPELKKRQDHLADVSKPLPIDKELARFQRAVKLSEEQLKNQRLTAAQDLAWALINTPSFLFNH